MEDTNKPNHVTVTVEADGTVCCTPDPVPAHGRDIKLTFVLTTDGYVFPEDGAVVVNDPGTEFPDPSKTLPPDNTCAKLFDRNSKTETFTYTVTVKQVATGECLRHDPTISNGP